ncbi:sucrose phosphatase [Raphidocelis subcapitata]|uniref:Sucrose phosphatase n=1 Tax=Raphidocelis subcapitata TaxID=307507 RepID=A0A2V0PDV1_9CHLO|nr:sucrose phosphatase [Raphidocelis subcapitata]|eukprot:GBF98024.1 sucrose phosphatase [Raphidocelis subcapitata]
MLGSIAPPASRAPAAPGAPAYQALRPTRKRQGRSGAPPARRGASGGGAARRRAVPPGGEYAAAAASADATTLPRPPPPVALASVDSARARAANPALDPHPDPAEVVYAAFRWPQQLGGDDVRVSGSWDSWASQTSLAPLAADGRPVRSRRGDAVRTLLVPRGVHDYKFVVDGKWRPAPQDPVARDQAGATNNKRLLTATGLITFKGRRDMEVLVMGDWSDWTVRGGGGAAPQPGEWREVAFDGAPSRAGPMGGRWMQAIIEAPGPSASLQFYVRGPRPDLNDEWGSSAARSGGGWGGAGGGGGGGGSGKRRGGGGSVDGGSEVQAEDRPHASSGATHYTLPWPSGWKLERGTVSKFLRALQGPIMLCSDVDGTFVTDNRSDAWGDSRIADFRTYWEDVAALGGSVLVLNTGRSKGALMELLRQKEEIIAVPDVIITAVGTKIWHRRSSHRAFGGCTPDDYEEDANWTTRLDEGWDLEAAREVAGRAMATANAGGETRCAWLDKGTEHPHRIALSVRVDAAAAAAAELEAEIGRSSSGAWGVKSHIITSGAGEWRYLDVVAERGGKLEAIEWVRALYGIPARACMAAGDSLNDVEMFKGEGPGVIVGNAQRELLAWYNAFREEPPGRILLARAPDAAGVLEGLARHGLL